MKTGEIIRQLRIEKGITQDELAKAVGYQHKSSITKIETGAADISQKKIAQIAKALDVTPDYLFFGNTQDSLVESGERQPLGYEHLKKFVDIISTMTEEEKKSLMDYMNFIVSQRK